jgi:hypothetical protein
LSQQICAYIVFFHIIYMHMRFTESNSEPQVSCVTRLTTEPQSHLWLKSRNIPLVFTSPDFESSKWIQMKKSFNYRVLDLVEIYNFSFDHFFHPRSFEKLKKWILKLLILKHNFEALNDFKWKSSQLQSCRYFLILQLLFKPFLHPRSFEIFLKIFQFVKKTAIKNLFKVVLTPYSPRKYRVQGNSPCVHFKVVLALSDPVDSPVFL